MPYALFQGGRRRRRSGWLRGLVALVTVAACAAGGALLLLGTPRPGPADREPAAGAGAAAQALKPARRPPLAGGGTAPSPLAVRLDNPRDRVHLRFKRPPRSGLLYDVDTGRVLWRRDPTRVGAIASLTKMMTALVVVDRVPAGSKVRISKEALRYDRTGSAVGVLPRGKWIGVTAMLHGLMLPSGNDAAIALAQRAAGSVPRFVSLMNRKAREMGLTCTRFSTPHGFKDRGNHSCAPDLAAISRAVLREPRLARIVRRRQAVLPFPIKGGRIFLYNNNPLLRAGYPGATGVKTGYTRRAGSCLVGSARHGRVRLGVVLLHSPDPGGQARKLLDRGFAVSARSVR